MKNVIRSTLTDVKKVLLVSIILLFLPHLVQAEESLIPPLKYPKTVEPLIIPANENVVPPPGGVCPFTISLSDNHADASELIDEISVVIFEHVGAGTQILQKFLGMTRFVPYYYPSSHYPFPGLYWLNRFAIQNLFGNCQNSPFPGINWYSLAFEMHWFEGTQGAWEGFRLNLAISPFTGNVCNADGTIYACALDAEGDAPDIVLPSFGCFFGPGPCF